MFCCAFALIDNCGVGPMLVAGLAGVSRWLQIGNPFVDEVAPFSHSALHVGNESGVDMVYSWTDRMQNADSTPQTSD